MSFRRARIINQDIVRAAGGAGMGCADRLAQHPSAQNRASPLRGRSSVEQGGTRRAPRQYATHPRFPLSRTNAWALFAKPCSIRTMRALHYYYNIEGIGPAGVRNYLATTDVDPISDSECQVTITARFDLAGDFDMLRAKNIINAAHLGVINGLQFNLEKSG